MPTLAPLTKAAAIEHTEEHRKFIAHSKMERIERIKLIGADIERKAHLLAGYSNLQDWLLYIGIEQSVSHFQRRLHDIKALARLPGNVIEQIPEGSAHLLARLPEHIRRNPEVIEQATTQKPAEFRATVLGVEAKAGITREKFKTFAVFMPISVFEKMVQAEEKVGRILQLDLSEEGGRRGANLIEVWEQIAAHIILTDVVEITGE